MAVILASARYGSGRYSVSNYGVINLSKIPTGVTATSTVNAIGSITSNIVLSSVGMGGSIGTVSPNLEANTIGVSATSTLNAVLTITTSVVLNSTQGTTTAGATTETAVVFNYEAVKTQYSRKRCVYIRRAA